MSDDRDYRSELEAGFAQLFGDAYRGLNLDCQRDWDWSRSPLGNPTAPNLVNERYILTIHVMYDVEAVHVAREPRGPTDYDNKLFVIGLNHPAKMEHNYAHKVTNMGEYFIVRAEYVTNNLSGFLEDLSVEATKAYEKRFYNQVDEALKT